MMCSSLLLWMPVRVHAYSIGGFYRNVFLKQQNSGQQSINNLTLNSSAQVLQIVCEDTMRQVQPVVVVAVDEEKEQKQRNQKQKQCDQDVCGDRLVPYSDIEQAFEESVAIIQQNNDAIMKAGWKFVHENELYTLFKRRPVDKGPVEYMMKGVVGNVSPRLFLHAQTNKGIRQGWDKTMSEMETDGDMPECLDNYVLDGDDDGEDTLYYRTKWPWPLKDRDYTLARRVHFFDKHGGREAIVFVSKATGVMGKPKKNGVIRVDNYWCRSAYFPGRKACGGAESSGGSGSGSGSGSEERETEEDKVEFPSNTSNNFPPVDLTSKFLSGMMPKIPNVFGSGGGGKKQWRERCGRRESSLFDTPGTEFVTIFCDDSKVPLPGKVIDMISTQAEKVVPDSMRRLRDAAAGL